MSSHLEIVAIIVCLIGVFIPVFLVLRPKNKGSNDTGVEHQTQSVSANTKVSDKASSASGTPANTKVKKRSVKGANLRRRNWDAMDFHDPLFSLHYPGYYSPSQVMYWHFWFLDNVDSSFENESFVADVGSVEEVVVEKISETQYMMYLLDSSGRVEQEFMVDPNTNVVAINDVIYDIDVDSDSVEMNAGGDVVAWEFDTGYNIGAEDAETLVEQAADEYTETTEPASSASYQENSDIEEQAQSEQSVGVAVSEEQSSQEEIATESVTNY
tara:strand:+ start:8975 stop:9784 length:810 start_codon:yes stop_codon:yes gene_type:complete